MSFVHGGNVIAEAKRQGVQVSDMIDMSSNLTPLGVVPGLEAVYQHAFSEIGCLPDPTSESLRGAFCRKYQCSMEEVIAGNGTTEFIYDLSVHVAANRVIIVNPTYSDYKLGCEYHGRDWQSFTLKPPDFKLSLEALNMELKGDDLVFICNPNNPTGTMTDVGLLHELIQQRPEITFVVDESYLPFTRSPSLISLPRLSNLFILCSSSKIYGIPGLRLGFMISAKERLAPLLAIQKPWVVNRPAQLCGEFLLGAGDDYVQEVVSFMDRVKPEFVKELRDIEGVEPVDGVTNFIFCRLSASNIVSGLQAELLKDKIMIRDCQSFDSLSDQYFRISLQSEEKNSKFLQGLRRCLA